MPQRSAVTTEVDQFKMKGRELIALATGIVANYDEKEPLPRSSISRVRHRAIVLLEGAISFVEFFLRMPDHGNGSGGVKASE